MSSVYFRIAARGSIVPARAPLLERLLARADSQADAADWRAQAFRLIASEGETAPAVATAALRGSATRSAAAWVAVATPVHLVAGMSSVSLPPDGILELDPAEADALAADFNRIFGADGVRLIRGDASLLLCALDLGLQVTTTPVDAVRNSDILAHLPRGNDSGRLRRLMSEIEMWLFDHAVNRHRRLRSLPAISGLWLWGEGKADADAPLRALPGWTAGDDPFFAAYGRQSHYPGEGKSGVVVIADWPGTPVWQSAEERWLVPAVADLKSGRLRSLQFSAGNRCLSVSARGLRRFWRRMRPWWETLGENHDH